MTQREKKRNTKKQTKRHKKLNYQAVLRGALRQQTAFTLVLLAMERLTMVIIVIIVIITVMMIVGIMIIVIDHCKPLHCKQNKGECCLLSQGTSQHCLIYDPSILKIQYFCIALFCTHIP